MASIASVWAKQRTIILFSWPKKLFLVYNSCSARKKEDLTNIISSTNHNIHANKELSP